MYRDGYKHEETVTISLQRRKSTLGDTSKDTTGDTVQVENVTFIASKCNDVFHGNYVVNFSTYNEDTNGKRNNDTVSTHEETLFYTNGVKTGEHKITVMNGWGKIMSRKIVSE